MNLSDAVKAALAETKSIKRPHMNFAVTPRADGSLWAPGGKYWEPCDADSAGVVDAVATDWTLV